MLVARDEIIMRLPPHAKVFGRSRAFLGAREMNGVCGNEHRCTELEVVVHKRTEKTAKLHLEVIADPPVGLLSSLLRSRQI